MPSSQACWQVRRNAAVDLSVRWSHLEPQDGEVDTMSQDGEIDPQFSSLSRRASRVWCDCEVTIQGLEEVAVDHISILAGKVEEVGWHSVGMNLRERGL